MNRTKIPWCDFTWSPVTGCTFGCEWCYARRMAHRITRMTFAVSTPEEREASAARFYEGRAANADKPCVNGFYPTIYPNRLSEPLRRKKPAVIFLGSMGDVFDPAIPDSFRDRIFMAVLDAPQHTFVVLTKRASAMAWYMAQKVGWADWPPRNLVLGVSVTNQADADERIPLLLATPAAKRMVSVEPMLGPVDLAVDCGRGVGYLGLDALDFVAVGGKTPGKPLHEQRRFVGDGGRGEYEMPAGRSWLRSLRDQCAAAGVPFHYKHAGTNPALDGVVYDAPVPR